MKAYGNVIRIEDYKEQRQRRSPARTREGYRARHAERQRVKRELRFAVEHVEVIEQQ